MRGQILSLMAVMLGVALVAPAQKSIKIRKRKFQSVVATTKTNILYRGVPNPVEIAIADLPLTNVVVEADNCKINKSADGRYEIMPGRAPAVLVKVSGNLNAKRVYKGVHQFRVMNVPDPYASFAGVKGSGKASRRQLSAAQGIFATMDGFLFDLKFRVISFSMSAVIKGKVVSQQSNSNFLTSAMKTILSAMQPKQKLYIENIKAIGPDGVIRNLGSIAIIVTG